MPGAGALELSFWSSEDPEARRGEDQKDTAPVANVCNDGTTQKREAHSSFAEGIASIHWANGLNLDDDDFPMVQPPRIKRKHLQKYSWSPDVLRVKGSIIPSVFGPVLTVTVFSVIVAYARSQGNTIQLANSVVPLLSVVAEFHQGWSHSGIQVRNLSRMIWVHVAVPLTVNGVATGNTPSKIPISQLTHAELRHQKIEHYLRGEDGADYCYTDRQSVLTYAAMQNSDASIIDRQSLDATKRVKWRHSKKNAGPQVNTPGSTTPLLGDLHHTVEFRPHTDHISMPLPLIIAHEISSAIFRFRREGLLETVGPAGKTSA
ncbi:hypothetical protein V8E55_004127 [Tylopilus felleus]